MLKISLRFLSRHNFFWLGFTLVSLCPHRADGAFASASSQAEFNIALAQYTACLVPEPSSSTAPVVCLLGAIVCVSRNR